MGFMINNLNNLPLSDQENLAKIADKCLTLKDRLEQPGFKVLKFKVVVSADVLAQVHYRPYRGHPG
jgi:hypothetical protein